MNDEKLAELREKYKKRNLREELSWGAYANHNGYTGKTNAEFLNWLCNAAYRRIKELEENEKWIPVKERLPEESLNSVIGWDTYRERCVFVQYANGRFQIMGSNESFNITAWMPLPDDYKESEEEL